MKKLITIIFALACICGYGQGVQWRNLNTSQFGSNLFLVSIKRGAPLTNPVVRGSFTNDQGTGAYFTDGNGLLKGQVTPYTGPNIPGLQLHASDVKVLELLTNLVSVSQNAVFAGTITGNGSGLTNLGVGSFPAALTNYETRTANFTTETNDITLGTELISNPTFSGSLASWTAGAGWGYSSGALHTNGNTAALSQSVALVANKKYFVSVGVSTNTAQVGTLTATLGGLVGSYSIVQAGLSVLTNNGRNFFSFNATGTSNATFTLTPSSTYNGTVTNVSIREIVTGTRPIIQSTNNGDALGLMITYPELLRGVSYDKNGERYGSESVAIGGAAMLYSVTAFQDTIIGAQAGQNLTTGIWDTGVGLGALYATTTGNGNTAVGMGSVQYNETGNYNTGIGRYALYSNNGDNNTAVGNQAAQNLTTGSGNTVVGYQAMYSATTPSHNAVFGYQSLFSNTNDYNSAFGYQALYVNTNGTHNSAFGFSSLIANASGQNNSAFGENSLAGNVSGNNSAAFGYYALPASTGARNSGMGATALQSVTSGTDNSALGYRAGRTATAGNANTTGNYNTYLGSDSGPGSATQFSYQTVVGAEATSTNHNTIQLGRDVDAVRIRGGLVLGQTNAAPAGFVVGTTAPVIWFWVTNNVTGYLVPGYAP